MKEREQAYLLLADGTLYTGTAIGAKGTRVGEICFSTGMVGYQETLTDPSFYGQVVVQTFPMVGNYGTNEEDFESKTCHLSGYVVRELCETPSNFRSTGTLESFLKGQNVVAVAGVDTRALTRKIREYGVLGAMLTTEPIEDIQACIKQLQDFQIQGAVAQVSAKQVGEFTGKNSRYTVVLYDFGHKENIKRELMKRGCMIIVVPYTATAAEILAHKPDGILLSNGPGNPAENTHAIGQIKTLMEAGVPTMGICLGHQLMALSQGAKSVKLKYGHRGANQPVYDREKDRIFITTQNHGFGIVSDSVTADIGQIRFENVNDKSCEGITYKNAPALSVQFHPEACSGPKDTAYLFDEFMKKIEERGTSWD